MSHRQHSVGGDLRQLRLVTAVVSAEDLLDETSDDVVTRAVAFVESLGKTPVVLEKEIPGFVANRILNAVRDEAIRLHVDGIATVEAIDTAWDRDASVDTKIIPMLGGVGFFGLTIPEEYGGLGGDDITASVRAANQVISVLGGYGYVDEYPAQKYLRDARVMTLYEGTSQIQNLLIGRAETGVSAFL